MAFERPTLAELVDRIQADFVSRLSLTGAVLRRSVVYVLSRVLAGAVHMLHGHLDFLARQLFADTSEEEFLLRQGNLFGVERLEATFTEGNVVIWGTNTTVIPIGTVLLRSDSTEYTTDAEVTIATLTAWVNTTAYTVGQLRSNSGNIYLCTVAGTSAGSGGPTTTATAITDGSVTWRYIAAGSAAVTAAVTATIAAEDGNADVGTALDFESPIAGANSSCTVSTGGLEDGTDEEEIEDYRTRVLERMRNRPSAGTEADYIAWAKEISGVTRVWVNPLQLGVGTVVVYFVRDDDAGSIIPSAGEVTEVQDYIDSVRPVTADVTVSAPTGVSLNYTIEITPDNSTTRAAVEAELVDMLRRDAEPGGTILLSQIQLAVGQAEGVTDYEVTVPAADVTHTTGQIAIHGTATWL